MSLPLGKVTDHFSFSEFRCKGSNPHKVHAGSDCNLTEEEWVKVSLNITHLCQWVLEPVRKIIGLPMLVSSGHRCGEYNKSLKGAAKFSKHIWGEAADFRVPRLKIVSLYDCLDAHLRYANIHGPAGLGIYIRSGTWGWLHVDIRDVVKPKRWSG